MLNSLNEYLLQRVQLTVKMDRTVYLPIAIAEAETFVKRDEFAGNAAGRPGIVYGFNPEYGIGQNSSANSAYIIGADENDITAAANQYRPITPKRLKYAVKVGITANDIVLTPQEKAKACAWLGAISTVEANDVILIRQSDGTTGYLSYGINSYPMAIPQRDGAGKLRTATPSDTDDGTTVINIEYAKSHFLSTEMSLPDIGAYHIYAANDEGTISMLQASTMFHNPGFIAMYTEWNTLQTVEPQYATDCVPLMYAENHFVAKINSTQPFLYGYTNDEWGLGLNAATIANTPQNTGIHTIPWYFYDNDEKLDNALEWNKFSLFTYTPTKKYAAANKKYVDDVVESKKLYLHKIAFRFKDSTKEYSITHKCYSTKSTAFTAAEWLEFLGAHGFDFAMEPCVLYDGDIATMVGTYRMTMLLRVITVYDTITVNDPISVYLWDNGIDQPDEYNVTFTGFTDTLKEI